TIRSDKSTIQRQIDILQRMIRLPEGSVWVIAQDVPRQGLIAVVKLPAFSRERLGRRSTSPLEYREFYPGVEDLDCIRYLSGNLLRPVLTGSRLRIFEKPGRLLIT